MRRLEKAHARLRSRLERRGVGTVGLGVAVLSSGGLAEFVSDRLAAAAVAAGTGGPLSAGVQALAGAGAAIKLLPLTVGLMLLLVGGGLGLADDGKELIAFRRGTAITAHDAQSGKAVRTFPLAGYIASVALNAEGKTVAAVGIAGEKDKKTSQIKIWEVATGREIRRLKADVATVGYGARLAFAADGKTLYLGTESGRILRWEVANGRALPDWPAHNGRVADLFLRPHQSANCAPRSARPALAVLT